MVYGVSIRLTIINTSDYFNLVGYHIDLDATSTNDPNVIRYLKNTQYAILSPKSSGNGRSQVSYKKFYKLKTLLGQPLTEELDAAAIMNNTTRTIHLQVFSCTNDSSTETRSCHYELKIKYYTKFYKIDDIAIS